MIIIWEQYTSKYKAGWIPAEHATIHNTACFTKAFIFVPVQDAKFPRNYEQRQEIKKYLCASLLKPTWGYVWVLIKIIFPDECIFRLNEPVNTQNARIWGTERPVQGRQTFSHSLSIMLWCGISKEKVIGSYFFQDGNMNGENYRRMLSQYAFPRLASIRAD